MCICVNELIHLTFFVSGSVYWILSTIPPPIDTLVQETISGDDMEKNQREASDDRVSETAGDTKGMGA